MLGNDDGLKLALEFQAAAPSAQMILMTGGGLSEEEMMVCRQEYIPILFKPFVADEVLSLIKLRYRQSAAGAVGTLKV